MTKPTAATWRSGPAEFRVEYLKSRHVLRLTGGEHTNLSVEVPIAEFLANLAIDVDELAPPLRYLLFAAVGSGPGVSPNYLVDTFGDEAVARQAFWALRMEHFQSADWAEVAAVQASGELRRLCWFGTPWGPGDRATNRATQDLANPPTGQPRKTRRVGWLPRRRASALTAVRLDR